MNRPIGAMIIAVVLLIRSIWGLITGLIALGMGSFAFLAGGYDPGATSILWALATLVIAAIMLVLAWGLFAMKPWAWMWTVIILVVGLAIDFIAGMGPDAAFNWFSIILSVLILIYLLASGVRSAYLDQ